MASHGEQYYKLCKRYYNGYSPEIVGDEMYMSKSVQENEISIVTCNLSFSQLLLHIISWGGAWDEADVSWGGA